MENKKNLIGKILLAIYGISCLIMAFFMNLSYGYNEIITKPIKNNRGEWVTERIENEVFEQISVKDLLLTKDTTVLDITTGEIRNALPISTTLIWISLILLVAACVLIILDVLKVKKHISFIASITILLSFILFMILPMFTHRDANGMGDAKFLMCSTVPALIGLISSIFITAVKGRKYLFRK